MDEYFITKKAVEIILENINEHFIKCLVHLSINDRYTSDIKLILCIVEYLKAYMETRRNDILSSCIKYTNKSYYLQLTDNLFRLIHAHLTIMIRTSKNLFIDDLINKYSTPSVAKLYDNIKDDSYYAGVGSLGSLGGSGGSASCYAGGSSGAYASGLACDLAGGLPDDTIDRFARKRIDSFIGVSPEDSKDAGTLFKDAYDKLKKTKSLTRNANAANAVREPKEPKSFELPRIEVKNDTNCRDLL
jgi:hypothetical protein